MCCVKERGCAIIRIKRDTLVSEQRSGSRQDNTRNTSDLKLPSCYNIRLSAYASLLLFYASSRAYFIRGLLPTEEVLDPIEVKVNFFLMALPNDNYILIAGIILGPSALSFVASGISLVLRFYHYGLRRHNGKIYLQCEQCCAILKSFVSAALTLT